MYELNGTKVEYKGMIVARSLCAWPKKGKPLTGGGAPTTDVNLVRALPRSNTGSLLALLHSFSEPGAVPMASSGLLGGWLAPVAPEAT